MKEFNKWVISAFIGVIAGAGIVLFSLPTIINSGLVPTNNKASQHDQTSTAAAANVNTITATNTAVVDSVEKVSDAVVGVINIQSSDFWSSGDAGTGSGVIYKKEDGFAYIVTNHHVIASADSVEVMLSNGTRVSADVLGSDQLTDLAVLKMKDQEGTEVVELGSSENLRTGETVLAIGTPLGTEFSGSVTQGIVSGLERTIPIDLNKDGREDWKTEVIQTDAAINPGNSGGALVNINGQLIGINSMKIAQDEVEGIGFAIPISSAKPIIDDLETTGEVQRPFVGIGTLPLSEVPTLELQQTLKLPTNVKEGVVVMNVAPESPAAKAGLKEMDVIVELDGHKIASLIDLRKYLYEDKEIGDTLEISYYRSGEIQNVTLTLSEQEDE